MSHENRIVLFVELYHIYIPISTILLLAINDLTEITIETNILNVNFIFFIIKNRISGKVATSITINSEI